MVKMSERFLLGKNGDVILRRVADQLRRLLLSYDSSRKSGKWCAVIAEGVFEIGRINIDLVGRESLNLTLLKFQCRHRTAREVIVNCSIAHSRPIANLCRM